MSIGKLVGIKSFKSKAGKEFNVLNVVTPYSKTEIAKGCFGEKVEEIFVPEGVTVPTSSDIGKRVDVVRDIVGNKAYVSDIQVLSR